MTPARGPAHRDARPGKLPGDMASVGQAINDRGEAVGLSLDAMGNLRASFWENGVMSDSNTLVQANSPLSAGSRDDQFEWGNRRLWRNQQRRYSRLCGDACKRKFL